MNAAICTFSIVAAILAVLWFASDRIAQTLAFYLPIF